MAGTFDEYLQEEDPLFTPVGGYESGGMSMADDPYGLISSVVAPQEDYSIATEQLYTPISLSTPEPEGTFATPTFDTDYQDDPFAKLLTEQIKESSDLSNAYSEELKDISDRQSKLTNSAENDWSTLGAALIGGIGGALAGGSMADIAGGAAAVGTTHYNNLEAQEKTKMALLEKDANRVFAEQKAEQGRGRALTSTQAQHAARMSMAQAQGKVIGTQENEAARKAKVEDRKEIEANKPTNDAYAKDVEARIEGKVLKTINNFPPGTKPLPGVNAQAYADAKQVGTPIVKVEQGYQTYLAGLEKVKQVAAKGSQMTKLDFEIYRQGAAMMADGRKNMAEVGQAITDSEWARNIAPYLTQKGIDIFSPTFDLKKAMDIMVHDRNMITEIAELDKGMSQSRARYFLDRGVVLPNFDYSTLSDQERRYMSAEALNQQSVNGLDFQQQALKWFPNGAYSNTEITGQQIPATGTAPTPTPTVTPPTEQFTAEQRAKIDAYKEEQRKLRAKK